MEELEEKFEQIINEEKVHVPDRYGFVYRLIHAVEDYFKQSGKQGGNTTKQRHPNHLKEISKKGVEAKKAKKLA